MIGQKLIVPFLCLSLLGSQAALANQEVTVLPETMGGVKPADMMSNYLLKLVRQKSDNWKEQYEQLKTPEQIAEYQKRLREKFIEAIGGLPEPAAGGPLNPQVTGVVLRDGYRVEKVIFESQQKHYVTAALFLPDGKKHKPPYPGVLVPCGHSANAKAYESYQTMGALLALNGMAALVFDPIDQGERSQMPSRLPELWGTKAHTMLGIGSILLGRNTARFEIWDGMRGIDYLQSRPEVDPNRIGCTGNSGGATQTSYLMALDDRIIAAAPSCYITSFERLLSTIGPQDAEQNIYGQLAFGMDRADYLMMRAPKPTLVCAATKDFFDIEGTWATFRYAKRLYSRMGFAERVELIENDAPHNYNVIQRQSVVRWMARWLLNKDEPIQEPTIELLSEKEIQCTPQGQVMLLEAARSSYDLNRDFERELAERRRNLWKNREQKELLHKVREMAGIHKLAALPEPTVEQLGVIQRDGYRIEKMILEPEGGIYLPVLLFVPELTSPQGTVLYVHENGKSADASGLRSRFGGVGSPAGPIEELVKSGRLVLAVDLRGTGETHGSDAKDAFTAYLLGRSYVGMRAEDILVCARFLQQKQKKPADLIAVGHVGVPALHAAALEPDLFASVRLVRALTCWSNIIESGVSGNQLINAVHGALTLYDLPDLAASLGDKLTVEQPLDAMR